MTLTTVATTINPSANLHESQQRLRGPSGTCPNCRERGIGGDAVLQQQLIQELEAQVKMLTSKATAAADKMADYEDELRRLRASHDVSSDKANGTQDGKGDPATNKASTSTNPSGNNNNIIIINSDVSCTTANSSSVSRFTSILGVRRQGSNQKRENQSHNPLAQTSSSTSSSESHTQTSTSTPTPALPTPRETTLEAALAHEQTLRRQAEGQLTQVNGELEDMSVQLFEQANEMVATERKARAKLEERVEMLERRDGEKRKRLERLEGALRRIERVKGLIGEG